MDFTKRRWIDRLINLGYVAAFLAVAGWGLSVWVKNHEEEGRRDDERRAEIANNKQNAKAALIRMKNFWNAEDDWDDSLASQLRLSPPFTLEVEKALIVGRPVIIFGTVQDARENGDGSKTVSVRYKGRNRNLNMRFELKMNNDSATVFLSDLHSSPLASFHVCIFAATVLSVEKVEPASDKPENDESYFLLNGEVNEAYATKELLAPAK